MLERVLAEWPSRKGLGVAMLVTLAATTAFVPVFWPLEHRLQASGHGIVALELAPDPAVVDQILDGWAAGGAHDTAMLSIQVDFAFLVAYSLALACLVLWTARAEQGAWRSRGFALVPWCLAAGLFDSVENALDLVTLHVNAGDPIRAPVGALFALAKFTLIAMALGYTVRGLIRRLGRRTS